MSKELEALREKFMSRERPAPDLAALERESSKYPEAESRERANEVLERFSARMDPNRAERLRRVAEEVSKLFDEALRGGDPTGLGVNPYFQAFVLKIRCIYPNPRLLREDSL